MYGYSSYGHGSLPYTSSPLTGYSVSSLSSYTRLPPLSRTSFYNPYQDLSTWQSTKSLYVPPRPIRIDTADIDVSGPRKSPRSINSGTLSTAGVIHRGRSVVRLQSRRDKGPRKSPGAMLAEKFMIKERKPSPKFTSNPEEDKKEHVFRTKPRDLATPSELCKIVVEEPNGREREVDVNEEIENKSRYNEDEEGGQSDGEQASGKAKQRPIKKVVKRPQGFTVRDNSGLNVLQESEEESEPRKNSEESTVENVQITIGGKGRKKESEPTVDEPVVETVVFSFKKKKKPTVQENKPLEESITESCVISVSPFISTDNLTETDDKSDGNKKPGNKNDKINEKVEIKKKIEDKKKLQLNERRSKQQNGDKLVNGFCSEPTNSKSKDKAVTNALTANNLTSDKANEVTNNNNKGENVESKNNAISSLTNGFVTDNGSIENHSEIDCDLDLNKLESKITDKKLKDNLPPDKIKISKKILKTKNSEINTNKLNTKDIITNCDTNNKKGNSIPNGHSNLTSNTCDTLSEIVINSDQISNHKDNQIEKEKIEKGNNTCDNNATVSNAINTRFDEANNNSTASNITQILKDKVNEPNLNDKQIINKNKNTKIKKKALEKKDNNNTTNKNNKCTTNDKDKIVKGTDNDQITTDNVLLKVNDNDLSLLNECDKKPLVSDKDVVRLVCNSNDKINDKLVDKSVIKGAASDLIDNNVLSKTTSILEVSNNVLISDNEVSKVIDQTQIISVTRIEDTDTSIIPDSIPLNKKKNKRMDSKMIVNDSTENSQKQGVANSEKTHTTTTINISEVVGGGRNLAKKLNDDTAGDDPNSRQCIARNQNGWIGANPSDQSSDKSKQSNLNLVEGRCDNVSKDTCKSVVPELNVVKADNVIGETSLTVSNELSADIGKPSDVISIKTDETINCINLLHPNQILIDDKCAKSGEIKRHASKRKQSVVEELLDVPSLLERRISITDELLVEEAKLLDTMIQKEMAGQRRKSSLGIPKIPDIIKKTVKKKSSILMDRTTRKAVKRKTMKTLDESPTKEVNNNTIQQKAVDQLTKAIDKTTIQEPKQSTVQNFSKPSSSKIRKSNKVQSKTETASKPQTDEVLSQNEPLPIVLKSTETLIVKQIEPKKEESSSEESSSEESTEEEEDTDSTESYESSSETTGSSSSETHGRFTPPATTIPRFRKYTIEDFQFLKVLGKGSFGKVLLAELKGSEYYYAVKCLKKDVVLEDDDVECTMIERKVLALGTGHPYLCHLFCTFQTDSHLFFVMEYLNGGDLMFHIQHEGRFDEGRARFYAAEIISGLKFLHKKGIVYRDLKLDNVLLDYEGHVRIADFGMCKLQIYLDKTADTFCGTPDYMAPEIIKGQKYNQCVDWWSFGILLYEMLVGQSPFSGCDEDDLFWSICNERPHIPKYVSIDAKHILLSLLEKEWNKRLGSSENGVNDVMDHDFFRGLRWNLLERRQLDPPFKPRMSHPLDTKYFDKAFTSERPRLTPIDKSILASMDQLQFQGFSYTNPNATE